MTIENNKNGYGFCFAEPDSRESTELLFPRDASEIMYKAVVSGSCVAEGSIGAGKSHLVQDLGRVARVQQDIPTLTLRAHISGGSKQGANVALREIDAFADARRADGLIIIDNVDYYGYSGCKRKRSYPIAASHTRVAEYLSALVDDADSPLMIGTAHDAVWRSQKWGFKARRGEDDNVTPAAEKLLNSFAAEHKFTGSLDAYTAARLLAGNGFGNQAAELAVLELIESDKLLYRIVSRLQPEEAGINMIDQINEIQAGTARLLGAVATAPKPQLQLA